jgi:hypothetical protein
MICAARLGGFWSDANNPNRAAEGLQGLDFAMVAVGMPLPAHLFGIHDGRDCGSWSAAGRLDGFEAVRALSSIS